MKKFMRKELSLKSGTILKEQKERILLFQSICNGEKKSQKGCGKDTATTKEKDPW